MTPGDLQTFANPTYGANARLVNLYSSYECDLVLFCLFAVVSIVFFLQNTIGESGMAPAPVIFLGS